MAFVDHRIEIPTSEPDRSPNRKPSFGFRTIAVVSLAAALILVLTLSEFGGSGSDPTGADGEIAPPATVPGEDTRPPLNAIALPGTGTVTAIVELDGNVVAIAAGDHWGSSVWRLDDASGTWSLAIALPGVTVLDAIAFGDGMAVVGFDLFDRTPSLFTGPADDLEPVPLDMGTGEVPYRVDDQAGSLYISSRFGDGSARAPAATYRIEPDGASTRLEPRGDAIVEHVVTSDRSVLAVGSAGGRPAMWRVGPAGELEPIDIDLDLDDGGIAAAGTLPSGEAVGLVIGGFGSGLPSTAVYMLEPPYRRLDEPIPGVWDRLVPAGPELLALPESLLALPASGVTVYRTDSGVGWVAGRAPFTGPGGGGPGEGTIVISDALFRGSGDLVVSGASSGQESFPIVASEASIGATVSAPAERWLAVEEIEPAIEVVHVGGIQVGVSEGVVTVRDDFGRPWTRPVFADEASVGGFVDVVELDFGYLLSATRPYPSLWYSSAGSAWQLMERDVIRIAGSAGSAIALVGKSDAPSLLRIDSTGVAEVVSDVDPSLTTSDRLGRVGSLGYVAGPIGGAVYVSETGVEWSALDLDVAVDAIQIGADALAVRTSSGWLRYEASTHSLTQIRTPSGDPLRLQVASINGGLLFGDRAFAWVTTDFRRWSNVSLGAWEGADGVLFDLWADEREVVALVGGPSRWTFVTLSR